jgi:hypothetical protein
METVSCLSSAIRAAVMALAMASQSVKKSRVHPGLKMVGGRELQDVSSEPPRHRNGITVFSKQPKACELYKADCRPVRNTGSRSYRVLATLIAKIFPEMVRGQKREGDISL